MSTLSLTNNTNQSSNSNLGNTSAPQTPAPASSPHSKLLLRLHNLKKINAELNARLDTLFANLDDVAAKLRILHAQNRAFRSYLLKSAVSRIQPLSDLSLSLGLGLGLGCSYGYRSCYPLDDDYTYGCVSEAANLGRTTTRRVDTLGNLDVGQDVIDRLCRDYSTIVDFSPNTNTTTTNNQTTTPTITPKKLSAFIHLLSSSLNSSNAQAEATFYATLFLAVFQFPHTEIDLQDADVQDRICEQ